MSAKLIEMTDEKLFSDTLKNNEFVFSDFYAPWCGPCRMMLPTVEQISQEISNVTFIKINVDTLPEIAAKYGISGIPRFLFFKNGEVVGSATGAMSKNQLLSFINEYAV